MSLEDKVASALKQTSSATVNITSLEQIGKDALGSIWDSMPSGLQSSVDRGSFVGGSVVSVVKESDNTYTVEITFPHEMLQRMSLCGYVGVYDIIGLFSKGYTIPDGKKLPAGMWHGNKTVALRRRTASKFVSGAVQSYVGMAGVGYKIVGCSVSESYT